MKTLKTYNKKRL